MTATRDTRAPSAHPDRLRRFGGLLPERMLHRRPHWWEEIAIIAFGYWLYTLGRNAIPTETAAAFRHAHDILRLEHRLGIAIEKPINHFVAAREWLAQPMDYYYATLHFVVTPLVLGWLFLRRPTIYRGARTVLVTTTLIALAGFALYPTAPPRLLPGFADTVIEFHTWGSFADPNIADHSNQFAAMPSLHLGWALWCGIAIYRCARHRWVRVLGALYPVGTFVVIIATANHYLFDALAGALLVAMAFAVQYTLSGHGAFSEAPPPAGTRPTEPAGLGSDRSAG